MNDKNLEYLKKYLPSSQYSFGVEKLKKGISPQYIVGNVDFYGNTIYVNSDYFMVMNTKLEEHKKSTL